MFRVIDPEGRIGVAVAKREESVVVLYPKENHIERLYHHTELDMLVDPDTKGVN